MKKMVLQWICFVVQILFERVIMTSGLPYTFWSAYGVEVPDLSPNDVLHLNAQAEVTNDNGFNVMVDGAFSNGLTLGVTTFKAVGLPTCQNVTPNMHHMVVARQAWVKGLTGRSSALFWRRPATP